MVMMLLSLSYDVANNFCAAHVKAAQNGITKTNQTRDTRPVAKKI
jgi:hypothetical protein